MKKEEIEKMTLKEAEAILYKIFCKEGQPIIVTHVGGYRGEGLRYSMTIGGNRIITERYFSLEELLKAMQEKYQW